MANALAEADALNLKRDPTLFSLVRQSYQAAVHQLLTCETFEGLTSQELIDFKRTYGLSAFFCRFVTCIHASQGFATEKERDNHERCHTQRYTCSDLKCVYSKIGFSSIRMLKKHRQDFHTTENPVIPDMIPGHALILTDVIKADHTETELVETGPKLYTDLSTKGRQNYYPMMDPLKCFPRAPIPKDLSKNTEVYTPKVPSEKFLFYRPDLSDFVPSFKRHLKSWFYSELQDTPPVDENIAQLDSSDGENSQETSRKDVQEPQNSISLSFEHIKFAVPQEGILLDELVAQNRDQLESLEARRAFMRYARNLLYSKMTLKL